MANEQEPVTITNSVEMDARTRNLQNNRENGVAIVAQEGGNPNKEIQPADNGKQQPADEGR